MNTFPKLHNAMWPGLVGKGSPGAEPCIDLDTMLDLTAKAEVNGVRFDGVDLFLFDPHVKIDIDDDGIKRLAEKIQSRGLVVGSVVAPVWPPTGGGSAMGSEEDRSRFVTQVRKACRIARRLRELGVRPSGVVRIDSACGVEEWSADPKQNQEKIARTFSAACDVAEEHGERLAAEGEICWGGMHSWSKMHDLLERVNRPKTLGFQADMAHTLLYVLGYNAPEDAILPANWDWSSPAKLNEALQVLTKALRPWTVDFHVAQNDATVKGSGTHDKTGHHCLPDDPNGKLEVSRHAGFWLRGENGEPTKAIRHICWDGCMFSNEVMQQQRTWNKILETMIAVREAHGWVEATASEKSAPTPSVKLKSKTTAKPKAKAKKKPAKAKSQRPAVKPAKKLAKKPAKKTALKARAVPAKPRKAKTPARKAASPSRAKATKKVAPRAKRR
jgi:sugar phosphate isomerase/epimerase